MEIKIGRVNINNHGHDDNSTSMIILPRHSSTIKVHRSTLKVNGTIVLGQTLLPNLRSSRNKFNVITVYEKEYDCFFIIHDKESTPQ